MTMPEKMVTIVNPAAGNGKCGHQAKRLAGSWPGEVAFTASAAHASHLAARYYDQGYRHFRAAGGDGTIFEIVNGLFPRAIGSPLKLSVLPLGTGNSLLRDFRPGTSSDELREIPLDTVKLSCAEGDFYFVNIMTMGFSSTVGRLTNDHLKPMGALGYALAVLFCIFRLKGHQLPYRTPDPAFSPCQPASLVAICNSQYTGGKMLIAPGANPSDGKVDIVHLQAVGRMKLLACFPRIFSGSHIHLPEVTHAQAPSVVFDIPQPTDVLLDGEVFCLQPRRLEVLHHAITLLI